MPEILQLTEGVLNVRLFGALEEQKKPPRRKQPKEACKTSRPLRIEHTRLESQPVSKLGAIHLNNLLFLVPLVGLRHGCQSIHGSGVNCLFCQRRWACRDLQSGTV